MADKELEMLKRSNQLRNFRNRAPMVTLAAVALLMGGTAMTVSGDLRFGLPILVMGLLSALLAGWHFHALRRLRDSER